MSDTDTCTTTSELGNRCCKVAGHGTPSDAPSFNKANAMHVAKNADGDIVQIWKAS